MCLAFPGKIVSLNDNQHAVVDFDGIKKDVNISLVDGNAGDYVIVHAGFAIQKLAKKEAQEAIEIYGEK